MSKTKTTKIKSFKDHRHDQSVGSVYRKLFGSVVLKDETYEEINGHRVPFGTGKNTHWPIWATRRKK